MPQIIRITSKEEGFRRAGVAHAAKPVDHPADRFDEEQLKALQTEPMLSVEIVESTPPKNPPSADERKTAIIAAMRAMLKEDPEQADETKWTKGKKPELDNVNRRLKEAGADIIINAKERDEVWAEVSA